MSERTVVDYWFAAVESVLTTDGPAGLTARRIHARAQQIATDSNRPGKLPTMKYVIYDLPGPTGEPLFGSITAVVDAAHANAVRDLHDVVNDATSYRDKTAGMWTYMIVLRQRPALRRLMATLIGPAGYDPVLEELHKQLTRYLKNQGVAAAVHGVIEGATVGTVAYPAEAIRDVVR